MSSINGGKDKGKTGQADDGDQAEQWPSHWPVLSLTSSILILIAIVVIVVLKFLVVVTGRPAIYIVVDSGTYVVAKAHLLFDWLAEKYGHLLSPAFIGLSWTLFSSALLYIDSKIPGQNPPTTLSPRRTRWGTYHHIGYLTSFATGVVVFGLCALNA